MTADVIVHWQDTVRMRVQCESSVAYELNEHFAFFVDGYKYMKSFKIGHWDGKIKLFDTRSRTLYRTLLPDLKTWCEENGYSFGYANEEDFKPTVEWDPMWLTRWNEYCWMEPHEHQFIAVAEAIKQNNLLLLSPTSSGKSLIIYLIVRYLLEKTTEDILITVPTTALVEQLFADFDDYSKETTWDPEDHVHRIYSGKEKLSNKRVIITTWQSVYNLPKTWFSRYSAYLCDEAHTADAKSITGIVDKLVNSQVRLGLTGTIEDTKIHELELRGRFGPVFRVATTKELQEKGIIAEIDIEILRLQYNKDQRSLLKGADYQDEIKFLITHPLRNKVLTNLALRQDRNGILLFTRVEGHGHEIFKLLQAKVEKYGKKVHYVHGKTDVDTREQVRQIAEKEENTIILASFGVFSTGTNIKNLHWAIFCHPYKAKIKTLQSIGRVLRKLGTKRAILFDIADDLVYTSRSGKETLNHTMKHFIERLQIYQREGFPYNINTIDLSG